MVGTDAVISIGTGKPRELEQRLRDPESVFYQDASVRALGLTPDSPLVQRLLRLASGGTNVYPHNFNTRTPEALGITAEDLMRDLRSLGGATERLSLMITVPDSHGRPVQLVPSEFNAWQGTVTQRPEQGGVTPDPTVPVDTWANRRNIGIQDLGPRITVTDPVSDTTQSFDNENPIGTRREVVSGRITTQPYTVHCGSQELIDHDPLSPTRGHPLIVGGDGALDVFIPRDVMDSIQAGNSFYGPVVIRLNTEGDRADPKVHFLSSPDATDHPIHNAADAIRREAENWQLEPREPLNPGDPPTYVTVYELAGVRFEEGIELPQSMVNIYTRSHAGFISMSGAQYQAWQYALSEHSSIRTISPQRWIDDTFGGRRQFDAAFQDYPDGERLPIEDYHQIIQSTVLERVQDSRAAQLTVYESIARSDDADRFRIVESCIYADGRSPIASNDDSRQGDGVLSTNEMGALLVLMQSDPAAFAAMTRELIGAGVQFASNDASNAGLLNLNDSTIQRG